MATKITKVASCKRCKAKLIREPGGDWVNDKGSNLCSDTGGMVVLHAVGPVVADCEISDEALAGVWDSLVDEARRRFEMCGAADDFCVQTASGRAIVFGGTNRVVWTVAEGFKADQGYCTARFLVAWRAYFGGDKQTSRSPSPWGVDEPLTTARDVAYVVVSRGAEVTDDGNGYVHKEDRILAEIFKNDGLTDIADACLMGAADAMHDALIGLVGAVSQITRGVNYTSTSDVTREVIDSLVTAKKAIAKADPKNYKKGGCREI